MQVELLDWESRGFNPPAFGTHTIRSSSETPVCSAAQRLTSTSTECLAPYGSFPATTSPNASVTFGCYLGNSCCGFRLPQSSLFQPKAIKNNENVLVNGEAAKKAIDMTVYTSSKQHYCDTSCGLTEFDFSQRYTGLYPRISGYIDLPLVQRAVTDLRYETCLPMEDHQQQWDWSNNWNSQLNYSKDQTESPHIWKSSLTEGTATSFYQRGRKKRVPYTKLQLRELEREYTNTKFITNEKRRQIASSTKLSERQVTIWFQNRRVKDKKIIPKVCK